MRFNHFHSGARYGAMNGVRPHCQTPLLNGDAACEGGTTGVSD